VTRDADEELSSGEYYVDDTTCLRKGNRISGICMLGDCTNDTDICVDGTSELTHKSDSIGSTLILQKEFGRDGT
jgi:hypothetical protein